MKITRTRKIALMISIVLSLAFALGSFGTAKAQGGYAPGYPNYAYGMAEQPGEVGYDGWYGYWRGNAGPVAISIMGPEGTPTWAPYCPFHERFDGWRCKGGDKGKYDFWGMKR